MSSNTLFNECLACKLKFDTRAQLENHVKRFCVQSDYGSQNKLEEKYQRELMALKKSNIGRDFPQEEQKQQSALLNPLSLEALKDKTKQQDDEYKRLQRMAQNRREEEMDEELNKLREQRQNLKLKRDDDQEAFQELLHDLEQKKEKEIRAKVEKDQIRRALMDLEKAKLTAIEQDKKRELERLVAEREALRLKEQDLVNDIQQLEGNAKQLDVMRKEELDKINGVIDGLQLKSKTNARVNEQMIVDKADQVARLRLKREQLEGERVRIMDNLDKIRNGDLTGLKKGGGLNLVANAKNILGDMRQLGNYNADTYKDRFAKDENRIRELKSMQPEYLPFDGDEAYQQRMPMGQMATDMYKERNPQTLGQVSAFRQGVEKGAQLMDLELSRSQQMDNNQSRNYQRPVQQPQQQHPVSQPQTIISQIQAPPQHDVLRNAWGVLVPQFDSNKFTIPQQTQQQFQQQQMGSNPNQFQQLTPYNPMFKPVLMPAQQQQQAPTTFGQFALNQLAPQQDSKVKDPWDIFSRKNEFFLMNEVRGVDLSEEEKVLMSLIAQEVDAMRVISRIPVGTELYRFKMEQFKELSTMRAEIEKIVQEQRLQDARRDFEMERLNEDRLWDNEKWVDDKKKFIFENRLRKDNTVKSREKGYTPSEGFVVHWDYDLGLPRRTNYCQNIFGVYNGQNVLYNFRLVEPKETETESQQHNRVIFGDSHQVYEIPPHQDTLMIIEVQIPFSKRVEENVGRTETYGWTQIDLFDHNKQLRRGKFKCPVYYGPTDPSITVEEIQNLEPIPNCWVYLRIGYPNDKDFGQVKSIYPEQTMHEYNVPYIHLRGLYAKRANVNKRMGMQEQEDVTRMGGGNYRMIEETIEESQMMGAGGGGKMGLEEYEMDEAPPPMQKYDTNPPETERPGEPQKKKGLRLIIYRVNNHQAKSHARVMACLLEEGNMVQDDNGKPVNFNTSVHNPLDLKNRQNLPDKFIIPLFKANPEYEGMNNKAKGSDIIFQEEYRIFRNLKAMYRKNKRDLFIGLQLLEKPEPVEIQESSLQEGYKNYAGLEFDIKGWQFLKVSQDDGSLLTGRFKMKMFQPPLRRPPIDPSKVREMEEVIDFALEEFEYDDKDIAEFKKLSQRKAPKPKPEAIKDVALDNAAYISNHNQQWINEPFERRHGIDFYIDGIRFGPDKVTVCKVYMEVYNRRYERILEANTASPDLNSLSYMPDYHFRRELRQERFDPTCIALMTVVTVDKSSNDNRIVGYAAINLFLNPATKGQPEDPNEDNFVAYTGCYQIPLFSQQLDRTPPFDMKKIYSHERSPCCTMLVRINKAPLADDNRRVLSIKEFPNPKDQIAKGLLVPQPKYGANVYNNELAPITESENELFAQRVIRPDITVREAANLLIKGEQINRNLKDDEIYKYVDERVALTKDTFMIDMMYFAKYRPQAGFKFTVDALHNVQNQNNLYVTFYSLSSPGTFYLEPRDVTQGHMSSNYYWESVINTPQYDDSWFTFKENANKYQNILIDVKSVPISKIDGKITEIGWTVLPVFSPDNYVMSNIYQLPLFRGPMPRGVIEDIKKTDAWDYLRKQQQLKKIFYLEYMSVIVRLVDSQREGHFNKPLDCDRLDYRYLPEGEIIKKWSYNPAVELEQLSQKKLKAQIPFKDNPSSFNRKLTEYFANSYGLTQYLNN